MWRFLVVFVAACTTGSVRGSDATSSPEQDQNPGPGPEALPPPHCGEGLCNACAGCGVGAGLCFGSQPWFALGVGTCVADSAAASITLTANGAAVALTEAAAAAPDAYVEISARSADHTLTFEVPATLGDATCSASYLGGFYYVDGGTIYQNRSVSTRGPCTVSLTTIGAVGERIEGSFTATVTAASGATVDLAGTFSVTRVSYP